MLHVPFVSRVSFLIGRETRKEGDVMGSRACFSLLLSGIVTRRMGEGERGLRERESEREMWEKFRNRVYVRG